MNLSLWMLVGAIRINSFCSFWKLHYFSDIACLKNPLPDVISRSSSTQLLTWHIFSVMLEPNMDPKCISLNIISISIEEIPIKGFPVCVFCIIWQYQCAKIIVASLLLLTVSYLKVYSYDWIGITTQKLSPNFLEKGL